MWSCQIRAWSQKSGNSRRFSSHSIFYLSVQRLVLQRSHPALLRHQSPPPSAPPSAGAGQRVGAGGVGGRPWPLAAGARGSGAPGEQCPPITVSAAAKGGVPDPAGSCPPGNADASLAPLSSPTSAKPEGSPQPSSHRAPGCAAEAKGPRHRARPFVQPRRWGSAQRAGVGRGDGVLTPAPPLSPPGTARSRPCPMPASPPRHTRPAKAAIGSSPAFGQSTSGPGVQRATKTGCCACATPATAHALSAALSVLDVWRHWLEEGERKVKSTDARRCLSHKENRTNKGALEYS